MSSCKSTSKYCQLQQCIQIVVIFNGTQKSHQLQWYMQKLSNVMVHTNFYIVIVHEQLSIPTEQKCVIWNTKLKERFVNQHLAYCIQNLSMAKVFANSLFKIVQTKVFYLNNGDKSCHVQQCMQLLTILYTKVINSKVYKNCKLQHCSPKLLIAIINIKVVNCNSVSKRAGAELSQA